MNLEAKVATKDFISNLLKTIEDQSKKISILEDKVAVIETHISQLRMANDNTEQYQRRLCLRIDGIDLPPEGQKESAVECLQKVKNVFVELGVEIPDVVIDHARRIDKVKDSILKGFLLSDKAGGLGRCKPRVGTSGGAPGTSWYFTITEALKWYRILKISPLHLDRKP